MTHVNSSRPRKTLIEVALPLDAINRGCESDKNRKTGHIRNIHKWFAPMPLPAWRAMLFASLVADPGEYLPPEKAKIERDRLFALLERLADFDSFKDAELLSLARAEISKSVGKEAPVIVDPFCGGGSTVLEAQRLGLACVASDLNPVPVLITTVLCQGVPLFAEQAPVNTAVSSPIGGWRGLAGFQADIIHYAQRVRTRAEKELAAHYPPIGGVRPFAYRWAWAVVSPDPAAKGALTPLVSDWWLSKHKKSPAWIQAKVENGRVAFSVQSKGMPPDGTTGKTAATCLITGTAIPLEFIRSEGRAGRLRRVLLAIAGRRADGVVAFVSPDRRQAEAAESVPSLEDSGIEMPEAALGFRVQQYGMKNFRDLFTPRQSHSLSTFAKAVLAVHAEVLKDAKLKIASPDARSLEEGGRGARAYADAVTAVLGLCLGKMAQSNCVLCRWFIDPRNGSGKATPAFDRHAIPMVWDFVETSPFGDSVGDWTGPVLETLLRSFELLVPEGVAAQVTQQDARSVATNLPRTSVLATDPPYYANIGYADLSDFFYMWLRKCLKPAFPGLFSTLATPKSAELIATPHRHDGDMEKASEYFRKGFAEVFGSITRRTDPRFPAMIVYAIKQAEETEGGSRSTGWEVFLGGLLDAGLSVVATWPMRTTTATRMIGIGTNALASAIFVICRPRPSSAVRTPRTEFVRLLRSELPQALAHLRAASIAPVDMAQAAIGQGMAIFSRFSAVLEADGKPLSVGKALQLIDQSVQEILEEEGTDVDADTRWALAWFEQSGFEEGEFGLAETLSKAKNTSVKGLEEAGILKSARGKARLRKPDELDQDWDPETDTRLTAWEIVHHLIRSLGVGGESAAAGIVAKLGTKAETARDLAYRLYTLCERKKRASDALAYNALVQSWPEITRLAREGGASKKPAQGEIF